MLTYIKTAWEDIKHNLEIILFLFIMWIVLFESFSWIVISSAIVVSIFVVLFTDRFLLKGNYEHSYIISLPVLIRYGITLIVEIFIAGIAVIPNILSGKADVQIVSYDTPLQNELLVDLLANSITLTPGTVTVHKSGSHLRVLTLTPPENDPREVIPVRLEDILLAYEKKTPDEEI